MRRWLPWLCILALGLRLLTINTGLLWYDEAFTGTIVKLPFLQMLQAIKGDVHPPLWYGLEWLMIRIGGDTPFVLRLPSALFGTAAVAELYLLVKRFAGETPARWAGAIMAVVPGQLYYSQEARMYALLTLFVLLAARAIKDHNWLRLALCLPLILYTQTLGWVYCLVLSVWALWESRGKALKYMAGGGLAYVPWAITAVSQMLQVNHGFWLSYRDSLGAPLYFLSFTTMFVRLPDQFLIHGIALALTITLVAVFGLRRQLKTFAPLMSLAFIPPALLYVVSLVWRPVLLDRGLLPAGAMVVGLWGAGLSSLPSWGKKALGAIAIPMALVAIFTYYTDPTGQRPANDPIRDTILAGWQDGDALYHVTLESEIAYTYYLPDKPSFVLPEAGDLAQSLTDLTKGAMGITRKEALFSRIHAKGYRRAWLFIVTNPVTSDYEISQAKWITDNYPTIQEWTFLDTKISKFRLAIMDLTRPGWMRPGMSITSQ